MFVTVCSSCLPWLLSLTLYIWEAPFSAYCYVGSYSLRLWRRTSNPVNSCQMEKTHSSYSITTGDTNEKRLDFWRDVLVLKQKAGNGCWERHSRRFIKAVSSCSPWLLFSLVWVGIGILPHLSFSLCLRHLYLDKSNLYQLCALGHSPCWCPLLCDDGLDCLWLVRVELCSPSPTAPYQNHIVMATLRTELKP